MEIILGCNSHSEYPRAVRSINLGTRDSLGSYMSMEDRVASIGTIIGQQLDRF